MPCSDACPRGGTVHIEHIQDQVELALMRNGQQKVARAYVLYREEHAHRRQAAEPNPGAVTMPLQVTLENGSRRPLDQGRLNVTVQEACSGLANVDAQRILDETLRNLYDGIAEKDVALAWS